MKNSNKIDVEDWNSWITNVEDWNSWITLDIALLRSDRWLFPKLIKIEIRESSEMGSVIFQYMKGVSIEDYKKNFSVG